MQWLNGDEARQIEPVLSPEVCAAIYAPEEAQIKAPQTVKAFSQAATKLGAKIYSYKEVVGIQQDKDKVTGINTAEGDTFTCNHLILTTGAWTGLYKDWFDITLPVNPIRGQILSLKQPDSSLQHIVFGGSVYLAPRNGTIIVGATKEDVGFDVKVTDKGISWLNHAAMKIVPTLKESQVERAWAGHRPKTPDKHPILGVAPDWKNVTLAVGHNSVGIILSAITGQAIAKLVTTHEVPAVIQPFSLSRFSSDNDNNEEPFQITAKSQ
ncbi:FAD-dependent oxidoreductase [Ktedonobacteria bacterium brp13]|nr:FAD-dependent oxidoreductase [Ktedonobacteria bacterium brp13]